MIPDLVDLGDGCPWPVLPPGIHDATLDEVRARFGTTPHRRRLFDGLTRALSSLRQAGCRTAFLDGSFVSGKPHPGDFDGCWDWAGVDISALATRDPVLLDFGGKRERQKQKYGGELFVAQALGAPGMSFLELFQLDKSTGKAKGILRIDLSASQGGAK